MASFVTNSEFILRVDARTVAQLVEDDATPALDLNTNDVLEQLLSDASGEVLSFTLRGGRYSEDDLNNLTSSSIDYLKRLVSDIALGYLVARRPGEVSEQITEQVQNARDALAALGKGEQVFAVQAVIDASHAQSPDLSVQTVFNQNYIAQNVRFFPSPRWGRNQL